MINIFNLKEMQNFTNLLMKFLRLCFFFFFFFIDMLGYQILK